jgi:hypothetical protein
MTSKHAGSIESKLPKYILLFFRHLISVVIPTRASSTLIEHMFNPLSAVTKYLVSIMYPK